MGDPCSEQKLTLLNLYMFKLGLVKEKYGSDLEGESEDSEEGESEDEDGEELTLAVDVAILRTLARIRRKDPLIYEQGKSVFEGA